MLKHPTAISKVSAGTAQFKPRVIFSGGDAYPKGGACPGDYGSIKGVVLTLMYLRHSLKPSANELMTSR